MKLNITFGDTFLVFLWHDWYNGAVDEVDWPLNVFYSIDTFARKFIQPEGLWKKEDASYKYNSDEYFVTVEQLKNLRHSEKLKFKYL